MKRFSPYLQKWAASWSMTVAALMLFADYLTGPYVSFPILFVLPVALLAWYRPCRWAILLAGSLCVIRQGIALQWWDSGSHGSLSLIFINTLIRMMVLFLVAILISRVAAQQRSLEAQVRTLVGILPVCGFCKKIRNEKDKWEPFEAFISRNSEAQFSHSVCPDCGYAHYPQFCESADPVAVPAPSVRKD